MELCFLPAHYKRALSTSEKFGDMFNSNWDEPRAQSQQRGCHQICTDMPGRGGGRGLSLCSALKGGAFGSHSPDGLDNMALWNLCTVALESYSRPRLVLPSVSVKKYGFDIRSAARDSKTRELDAVRQ